MLGIQVKMVNSINELIKKSIIKAYQEKLKFNNMLFNKKLK